MGDTWDFSSGRGLSPKGLTDWEQRMALSAIATFLVDSEEFERQAEEVHTRGENADVAEAASAAFATVVALALPAASATLTPFVAHAASVAQAASVASAVFAKERDQIAYNYARRYIWRGAAARKAIAELLKRAAAEPTRARKLYRMENAGLAARFDDADADPGDRRYVLRVDGTASVIEGAVLITLRGGRRCLACSKRLSASSGRRNYCYACDIKPEVHRLHGHRMGGDSSGSRSLRPRPRPVAVVPRGVPRARETGPGEVPDPAS